MDRIAHQSLLAPPEASGFLAPIHVAPRASPRFDLAGPGDDAEIRRLLRENVMPGRIRLSLEPAPNAALGDGADHLVHQTVVARRDTGGLFGLGARSVREAYINGVPTPLGYLSALRVDPDHRSNPRVILRGYKLFRELHEADRACDFYFTSILADNLPARRFLEANVAGMPTYRYVGEFIALAMPVRAQSGHIHTAMHRATAAPLHDVDRLLDEHGRRRQFAPVWNLQRGLPHGLADDDFHASRDDSDRLCACAALWDQRSFKQTMVRGYSPWLARWHGVINLAAAVTGRPTFPAIGSPLSLAYLSHLATSATCRDHLWMKVIEAAQRQAASREIKYLLAGLPADDRRLPLLRRRFGGRVLRSRLYVVFWPDGRRAAEALDHRPLGPDLALL